MSWTDYEVRVWGDMVTITCQRELLCTDDKSNTVIRTNAHDRDANITIEKYAAGAAMWIRSLNDALARIREENA